MDNNSNIIGTAAPATELTPEAQFEAAVVSLKAAAIRLDPTIKGVWIGRDFELDCPEARLSSITFDRNGKALAVSLAMRAACNPNLTAKAQEAGQ